MMIDDGDHNDDGDDGGGNDDDHNNTIFSFAEWITWNDGKTLNQWSISPGNR